MYAPVYAPCFRDRQEDRRSYRLRSRSFVIAAVGNAGLPLAASQQQGQQAAQDGSGPKGRTRVVPHRSIRMRCLHARDGTVAEAVLSNFPQPTRTPRAALMIDFHTTQLSSGR